MEDGTKVMITTQRFLKIGQLLCKSSQSGENNYSIWGNKGRTIFTSKSWVSLRLIIELYIDVKQDTPTLIVPEYYCEDTLSHLRDIANIQYYKINDDLTVNVKDLNATLNSLDKVDFFIGVHFFGKEFDFNNIKSICKNNSITFIEDAVHVTVPYGKIGKYGDLCIYSPWKIYGTFDGAILNIINDEIMGLSSDAYYTSLYKKLDNYCDDDKKAVNVWRGKKLLLRFLPNIRRRNTASAGRSESNESPQKVSEFSKRIIQNIGYEEIETLLERKEELSKSLEDYLKRKYGVSCLFSNIKNPYAIIMDIPREEIKKEIKKEIDRIGAIAFEWPELPNDLPDDTNAYDIKKRLLCITVHDGITLKLISRVLNYKEFYRENLCPSIAIEMSNEEEYDSFISQYMNPILQGRDYCCAKRDVQGWKRTVWKATKDRQIIAVFTVLSKYGIVRRINHGPVFIDNINDDDKMQVVRLITKKYSGVRGVLFFAPSIERNGFNINSLCAIGYNYQGSFFRTGFIDLTQDEEILRKNINGKWRNCLKNAEKRELKVKEVNNESEFSRLLELHIQDKQSRGYSDSGDDLTRYLYKEKALVGLYIENSEGKVISYVFIVHHGCTATYYIGWSNEEGYRTNAGRLLLWSGMIKAKESGIRFFDLGGIDYIHTKGVAEFKEGTGCTIYDYVGEFLAL